MVRSSCRSRLPISLGRSSPRRRSKDLVRTPVITISESGRYKIGFRTCTFQSALSASDLTNLSHGSVLCPCSQGSRRANLHGFSPLHKVSPETPRSFFLLYQSSRWGLLIVTFARARSAVESLVLLVSLVSLV